jgi:hypothetical protein
VAEGPVFLSYVHEDEGEVDQLAEILGRAGFPVWRDTTSLWPGEDWRAKIRNAIRDDALAFVACFSSRGVTKAKSHQNEEIVLAVDELRRRNPDQPWLFPVRFDDCQIPDRAIGGGKTFSDLQRADLFGPNYQRNADLLVASIKRIFHPGQATAPEPAGPAPGSGSKYTINLNGAQNVQIGDGNIQYNKF